MCKHVMKQWGVILSNRGQMQNTMTIFSLSINRCSSLYEYTYCFMYNWRCRIICIIKYVWIGGIIGIYQAVKRTVAIRIFCIYIDISYIGQTVNAFFRFYNGA